MIPIPGRTQKATKKTQKHHISLLSLKKWQGRQDLNPQPSVLETDALPIELLPCENLCDCEHHLSMQDHHGSNNM